MPIEESTEYTFTVINGSVADVICKALTKIAHQSCLFGVYGFSRDCRGLISKQSSVPWPRDIMGSTGLETKICESDSHA